MFKKKSDDSVIIHSLNAGQSGYRTVGISNQRSAGLCYYNGQDWIMMTGNVMLSGYGNRENHKIRKIAAW